jgi:putative MATE family efflux protein
MRTERTGRRDRAHAELSENRTREQPALDPGNLPRAEVNVPRPAGERPSILRMTAPLVVSFWMRAAFSLVDTAYAATIGDEAVAAIGLTVPFEFLMIALWVGLSTGLTSHLSRAMGGREARKIEQYLAASWRIVTWVLIPLFAAVGIGIWFVAPRLELATTTAQAFQVYGTVLITGSAVTAFWSVVPDSLVKAHHDTRSTMWAGIYSNVLNVTLNTLFLFVFHWGVFGIALSTVIGRIGGLLYALARARRHEAERRAAWTEPLQHPDPHPYRSILSIGFPSGLTFMLMSAEVSIVNFLLSRTGSPTEAIAAFSIYHRVLLFAVNPVIATAVAMLPFSARLLGERDPEGVRRGLREAMGAAAAYAVALVAPALLLAAPPIARALAESPVTRSYAIDALRLVPLACLLSIPFLLARPVFEGMGRGRPGLFMATLRYVVLSVPLAWAGLLLARSMDAPGFHGILVGTIVATAIASAWFWAWVRSALRDWDE